MHRSLYSLGCLGVAIVFLLGGCVAAPDAVEHEATWGTLTGEAPIIIAHRGASGVLPEHTLAAYALAIDQGADYIEPDVVMTRDGVAVCRHDLHLADSTDVELHPEFSDRRRTIGQRTDWFVFDFTLDELQTLRAEQVFPDRDHTHDGRYTIPTLSQVIDLVERSREETGRSVGLYIEIKSPAAHGEVGLDPGRAVVDTLARRAAQGHEHQVFIQCFERQELERLSGLTDDPLVFLSSNAVAFDQIPSGVTGLGLRKDAMGDSRQLADYLATAHRLGYFVHLWTFRDDRLPETGYESGADEVAVYLRAGVDGVFTDFPATGCVARDRLTRE